MRNYPLLSTKSRAIRSANETVYRLVQFRIKLRADNESFSRSLIDFVTMHPFDDGNGCISRAITDMQLSEAGRVKSSRMKYCYSKKEKDIIF